MPQPTWQSPCGRAALHHGDCLAIMPELPEASVDAVVCDPPYGLGFMGAAWDHGVPGVPFWKAALRVAKPGAHLLAFGGTRTFHRLAVAIDPEDKGFLDIARARLTHAIAQRTADMPLFEEASS